MFAIRGRSNTGIFGSADMLDPGDTFVGLASDEENIFRSQGVDALMDYLEADLIKQYKSRGKIRFVVQDKITGSVFGYETYA